VLMLQCFETQAVDDRASFAGKEVCNDTTHWALAIEQLRHHPPGASLSSRLRIVCFSALG